MVRFGFMVKLKCCFSLRGSKHQTSSQRCKQKLNRRSQSFFCIERGQTRTQGIAHFRKGDAFDWTRGCVGGLTASFLCSYVANISRSSFEDVVDEILCL